MKFATTGYVYIIFVLTITTVGNSQAQDLNLPSEVRGVWLTNVDSKVLYDDDSIAVAMKRLAGYGFNVVFPVVYNGGYTQYPSSVMAKIFGEKYRIDTSMVHHNIDPLQQVVIEAHRNNMAVIPWFEFGFASSYNQNGGHILNVKPSWAARDKSGNILEKNNFEWMNGIHPEVQEFITNLIVEVIENYDVDGIQGDDRLPAMPAQGGYSTYTKNLYLKQTGQKVPDDPKNENFMRWKAKQLTLFLGNLYDEVKKRGEHLVISLSPSVYPWSYENYLQNSPEWYKKGYVDLLIPQVYRYDIESYTNTLEDVISHHQGIINSNTIFASGILIKSGQRYNGPEYVNRAIQANRNLGVKGEVYFFYEGLDEKNENLGLHLKNNWYNPNTSAIKHTSQKNRITEEWKLQPGETKTFNPKQNNWRIFANKTITHKLTSGKNKLAKLTLTDIHPPKSVEFSQGWQHVDDLKIKIEKQLSVTNNTSETILLLFKEDKRSR